jgi:hypothetical protein
MRTAAPALVLLLAVAPAPSAAQVAARQGTAPPPQEEHFASPMVLDLPLPNVAALGTGSALRLPEVRKYICDQHVSLLGLTVSKQYKGFRKARSMELVVAGSVFVDDSYDRRVDIAVKVRSGGQELAAQTLRHHSAEEERTTPFRVVIPVDEARLTEAAASEHPPVLELTLTVRDDS